LFVFEIEGVFAVTRHIPVRLFSLYHDKILFNIFKLKSRALIDYLSGHSRTRLGCGSRGYGYARPNRLSEALREWIICHFMSRAILRLAPSSE
ncbi:TPA: hypothetical protein ACIVRR_004528, partial [Salmonella enterica subsp. diarizonae serovar 61:r:-]